MSEVGHSQNRSKCDFAIGSMGMASLDGPIWPMPATSPLYLHAHLQTTKSCLTLHACICTHCKNKMTSTHPASSQWPKLGRFENMCSPTLDSNQHASALQRHSFHSPLLISRPDCLPVHPHFTIPIRNRHVHPPRRPHGAAHRQTHRAAVRTCPPAPLRLDHPKHGSDS